MLKSLSQTNSRKNIFFFLLGIISFLYFILLINFYFNSKKIFEIKLFTANPLYQQDHLVKSVNLAFEKFLSKNNLHQFNIEKINIRQNTTTLLIEINKTEIKKNDEILAELVKVFEKSVIDAYENIIRNELDQLRYIINSDLFSNFDYNIKKSYYTNFSNAKYILESLSTNKNIDLSYIKILESDDYLFLHFFILYFICVFILGLFYFKKYIQKIL